MTLEQLDQLLASWKNKIQIAGQNLIELQELPTYQRLAGTPGFPKVQLSGITAARVTPALAAMNDLFEHFSLLSQIVNKAVSLRQQLPRFFASEEKIVEIEQLLTGNSIQLPIVRTPLAKRSLLTVTQAANTISPEQLLDVMTKAFEVARDAVLEVDVIWCDFDWKLIEAEAKIQQLRDVANSLGCNFLQELVDASGAIAQNRQRLEEDPLGVSTDFEKQIQQPITQVKVALEQVINKLTQVRQKLAIAKTLMVELEEIHHRSKKTFTSVKEKVVDCSTIKTPLPQEHIEALKQWLTRLETKLVGGLVSPVMVGLDNWTNKASEYISSEQETDKANQQALDTRQELRGRLDALQAKALARGVIEDSVLTEIALQAKQLLYTRPTPLDKASYLVSQYEKRLNR